MLANSFGRDGVEFSERLRSGVPRGGRSTVFFSSTNVLRCRSSFLRQQPLLDPDQHRLEELFIKMRFSQDVSIDSPAWRGRLSASVAPERVRMFQPTCSSRCTPSRSRAEDSSRLGRFPAPRVIQSARAAAVPFAPAGS